LTIFAFGMKLNICALRVPPPAPSKEGFLSSIQINIFNEILFSLKQKQVPTGRHILAMGVSPLSQINLIVSPDPDSDAGAI